MRMTGLTCRCMVSTLSAPETAVRVTVDSPASLKVTLFQVSGSSVSQTVESAEAVVLLLTTRVRCIVESQPAVLGMTTVYTPSSL